jgi:hypothetical protein
MLDNHIYNLLLQATEEHKSLWRIKNEYKKDASSCEVCRMFWEKAEKDKEDFANELTELIKTHLK